MKKIVFIHMFNDRSGSPKVLSQVIASAKAEGMATELITSSHEGGFLDGCTGRIIHSFYRRSENKLITLFCFLLSQCHIFFLCLRYFNQDAVFYVNTMMPFSAGLAGRLLGKRVIFHVHETSVSPKALKRLLRSVIECTANEVIFVSKYLSEVEQFDKPIQKIVHNAIDEPALDSSIASLENDQVFGVLMVCSLKKYKGIFEFIELSKQLPDLDFTLVLNADQQVIDKLMTAWKVRVPPGLSIYARQADLSQFYLDASVVLNLSRPDECVETFGLTILEAMSYGKPVIVPNVGGPTEIVSDGVEGYCISCYDLEEIKAALVDLSRDSELYRSMSGAALRRVGDFRFSEFHNNIVETLR